MNTSTYLLIAAAAYLLGSIPFGYLLVRVFRGEDVRASGSGNIGATNVARKAPGLGIATLVLDALKGYVAVMLAAYVAARAIGVSAADTYTSEYYFAVGIAAVGAMIGHIFPVWLKFKGGKGVATGVGVFLALVPQAVGLSLLLFAAVFALFRYVSLASIAATAAFPILAFFFLRHNPSLMPFIITAAILIIAKHHQNIRRLMTGTENRLELKSK